MVAVPVEVSVSVGGFAINRCYKGFVGSQENKGVQERYGTIVFEISCGELDVGVNRVDMLGELVAMFKLLDDEGIIHNLSQSIGGWGQSWWL